MFKSYHSEYRLGQRSKKDDEDVATTNSSSSTSPSSSQSSMPQPEWVDVGTGPLRLLSSKYEVASRVVMRREKEAGGGGKYVISTCTYFFPI